MMPKPILRVRLTSDPRDFRVMSAAPGMPLLDRHGGADSLLRGWLGRFVAEPTFTGDDLTFHVHDDRGRPVSDLSCELVSPDELKGQFRQEFETFKQRLRDSEPTSDSARTLQRFVLQGLEGSKSAPDFVALGCQFFKYLDHDGVWKLVWCAGLAPSSGKTCLRPTICRNPDCRRLITGNIEALETAPCPACNQPLLEPKKPPRRGLQAVLLLLLLGALGGGGAWYYLTTRPGTLVVRVTTAEGRPLPKARVRIVETGAVAEADDEGRFRIDQAGHGKLMIEVAAEGYRERSTEAVLTPRQETALEVSLVGDAQVAGRVVYRWNDQELPIAGAQVVSSAATNPITTDQDGRFRIGELAPQSGLKLEITANGFRKASSSAIAKGGDEAPHTIVMFGSASIKGTTVYAAYPTQVVAQAEVRVSGLNEIKTKSDAAGNFTLLDLPPVEMKLQATSPGMTSSTVSTVPGNGNVSMRLQGSAVVEGNVVRLSDDAPLANIEVRASDLPFTAKTDDQGKFRMEGLPTGEFRFRGAAPSLVGMVAAQLAPNQVAKVRLALSGGAMLSGRIVDAVRKQPVANARVRVADTMETKTDAEGKFEFVEVPESAATLLISSGEFVTAKVPLKLSLGQQRLSDVALTPGALVQGRVVGGPEKKPLAGADVSVVGSADSITTDADGKFSVGPLPLGPTKLRIVYPKWARQEVACNVTRLNAALGDVTLAPLATLTGRVVRALDKSSLVDAQVELQADAGLKTRTGKSGEYRLDDVPFGAASLKISAPGYLPQTLTKDVTQVDVSLEEVTLVGDTAASGIVVDATDKTKSIAGATVDVEIGAYKTSIGSGGGGKFLLGNIPAGAVRIKISAPGYATATITKNVGPTESLIEAALEPLLEFKGVVVDAAAAPRRAIPNAKVVLVQGDRRLEGVSGADGAFSVKGVEPDKLRVEVSAAGFDEAALVDVDPEKWLEVDLAPLIQVHGRVHAAERTTHPIGGARITAVKGSRRQEAMTTALGEFVVEMPIGEIEITAQAAGRFTTKRKYRAVGGTALAVSLPQAVEIKGYAVDATTNKAVLGAAVEVTALDARESTKTDEQGLYAFPNLPAGPATVKFTATGYEPFVVSVAPGEGGNVRAVLCPTPAEGAARIVLTWTDRPRDLDIHILGTDDDGKPFHMSFDRRTAAGATLDIDDKDGFGPETCTLKVGVKPVRCYVAHAAMIGEPSGVPFTDSSAVIHAYLSGEKESPVVRLPAAVRGPVWYAFDLVRSSPTGPITLTPRNEWLKDVPAE